MTPSSKNVGTELFRVVCMLAICFLHAIYYSSSGSRGFEIRLFDFGVVGFALITGYYGVSFSWRKLIKLWSIALYCACLVLACRCLALHESVSFRMLLRYLYGNWYLNGYTVLLILSPMLNLLMSAWGDASRPQKRAFTWAFLTMLGWSWAQTLWGIRDFVPHVQGMGRMHFLTLIYIYIIGQWLQRSQIWSHMRRSLRLFCLACILFIPLFGANNSPFTIVFSVGLFGFFRDIRPSDACSRLAIWLVPSLFSVYLLHTNDLGQEIICRMITTFTDHGLWRWGAYLSCTIFLFVGCLVLDMPRRICGYLLRQYHTKRSVK